LISLLSTPTSCVLDSQLALTFDTERGELSIQRFQILFQLTAKRAHGLVIHADLSGDCAVPFLALLRHRKIAEASAQSREFLTRS
jgi:hypothetical protein